MTHRIRIAYILSRFPNLSQTFIMNEMIWIRQHNIKLFIFSLFEPKTEPVHEQTKSLLPDTFYIPTDSWEVIKAQFHFLMRSPTRYLKAFAKTIQYTYREPKLMVQALSIFPKCVFFARQAEELEIDYIHVHFILLASVAAKIITILLDIPLSICAHASGLFQRNQNAIRRQLEEASKIITISHYHQDYITKLCPNLNLADIEVVHCGIETNLYQQTPNKIRSKPVRIISVGRLVEKKGHEYLVDACRILVDRGLELRCMIAGNGPDKKVLQNLIDQHELQDQVTLLGALNQSQVVELCQTGDIFTLACVTAKDGNQDGIPVSLMEAMSCELPVVTTAIAGIPDLVKDRETGFLVRERDSYHLADALELLIKDEVLCKQLGKNGRQKVVEDFEIQKNVIRLSDIFQRVVDEHNQRITPGRYV
jgi:colanic acid/amylovoran biosynthesis glycosyltransferase